MFRIEMLPAGHGDCLVIEYGDPSDLHRVLVDGGPYYAFSSLAQRIDDLAASESILELLVVSHVDADHIDGAIKLLGTSSGSLTIRDIWFNSWEHLSPAPADLLGPVTGEMLRALIQDRELPWNLALGGRRAPVALPASGPLPSMTVCGGLRLTLLSPTRQALARLKPYWAEAVRKAGLEEATREEILGRLRSNARLRPPPDLLGDGVPDVRSLARRPFDSDSSPANGSSIALLAEYEGKRCLLAADAHASIALLAEYEGKRCLLAADAHAEELEASVQRLLRERGQQRLEIDAVKLSHHGSKGSTSDRLLRMLDCKRFLVSTNGNYFRHPDSEAISRVIVEAGPDVELFFNYASDETRLWGDEVLQRRHRYRAHYPAEGAKGLSIEL